MQTCLVGKNEAGKTALLTALYRTKPIIAADANFDLVYDYPKREIEDYQFEVENKERDEVVVVKTTYRIEQSDKEYVAHFFGPNVFDSDTLTRLTYYGKARTGFSLSINEQAAREFLVGQHELIDSVSERLLAATDWEEFTAALSDADVTEAITSLKEATAKFSEKGLKSYIYQILLLPKLPKFLYFDEFYQMTGQENLNALIAREDGGTLEPLDRPLLGLIGLARLDHRELIATNNTAELKNKLEGASNHLTRRIIKYWSQNKHIQMRFDVRDAKPNDPVGMTSGVNVWGEVYDNVHYASTPLGSRSRGFVWFFSFLAWYEDIKRKKENVTLLLDEPGLSLHGRAQADLLRYFEEELKSHQVIYSTHSPFMLDPAKFERIRIVQDLGVDATEELPKDLDGTKVVKELFDATPDSLFPLQGALGYDIQQTLFIGPNSLIVEGPADMLFINAISAELGREGRTSLSDKWVITPVGGSSKVPTFVSLLGSQKGLKLATLLDVQDADRQQIEGLYRDKLLKKKNVLTYADFLDENEADVEDMFEPDFYVEMVNGEFGNQLSKAIDSAELNDKIPRVLRSIEDWLKDNPMKTGSFGHYRPARYFTENIAELWPKVSDATKDRFEKAFQELNALL